MSFLIFYITHPDEFTARHIGQKMVELRLAACANYFPIQSSFWWQNNIQTESEWVSLLKTAHELSEELEHAIQTVHPYDVPCILRWEVQANEAYENWVHSETIKFRSV